MSRKSSLIAFIVAATTLGSTAFAATDYNTTLATYFPEAQPGIEVSVTGLALVPAASNLNYVIYNKELPAQTPNWTEKEIMPGYSGAFAISGRYAYMYGKDLQLEWTHFNNTSTASVAAPNFNFFLGPDFDIGPEGLPIRNADGKAIFKYDVVNLDAGQYLMVDQYVAFRFFGGLSYADLREQVNATYSGNVITGDFQGPFSTQQRVYSDFYGIGPRFGIETHTNLGYGFGIIGEAASSLLFGHIASVSKYNSSSAELLALYNQTDNFQTIKDQYVYQTVVGFDAKLGVSYKYMFGQSTLLTLEGGYQGAVYVNAISQYIPASLVPGVDITTGGIFVQTMSHTLSNYSVQGPFLKGSLQFGLC